MASLIRAGTRVPTLYPLRRRTALLGLGALAAAGLATLAQRSNLGYTRPVTLPHWGYNPITRPLVLHRSLSSLFSSISSIPANSPMASLTPPQAAPSWTHSPEDVTRITNEMIEKDRKLMDKIAALDDAECTFDSVRGISFYAACVLIRALSRI